MGMSTYRATAPKVVFKAAGECIYCGRGENLSTEHIIPFGLCGNLELPAASCQGCATLTSDDERVVQRDWYGDVREVLNFPTRRKKRRTGKVQLLTEYAGVKRTRSVPAKTAPVLISAPRFGPAGILVGRPADGTTTFAAWGGLHDPHKVMLAGETLMSRYMSFDAFPRMLAKIAHAHTYAMLGDPTADEFDPRFGSRDGWEWLLPDYIRRKTPELQGYLVGGDLEEALMPAEVGLHMWRWRAQSVGGAEYLVYDYRMLPVWGTPAYHVVVARRRK